MVGYVAACMVGGTAAGVWAELVMPDGNWVRSILATLPLALIVCLPTFIFGRWVLLSTRPLLWYHHVLLWMCAGSLPPLIIAPSEIGLITAVVLLPFGALAGLFAYVIENGWAETA
jgi:hypothetical protein